MTQQRDLAGESALEAGTADEEQDNFAETILKPFDESCNTVIERISGIGNTARPKIFIPILADLPIILGRSPDSTIVFEAGTVSSQHATIVCVDRKVFIQDCNSTHGTSVNLVPLELEQRELQHGDVIRLGMSTTMLFIQSEFAAGIVPIYAGVGQAIISVHEVYSRYLPYYTTDAERDVLTQRWNSFIERISTILHVNHQ